MSLDRSLKAANALVRHRNVLTRPERLEKLAEMEKWSDAKSVYGLPKVGHRKMAVAKAVKEEAAEGAAAGLPAAAAAAGRRCRRQRRMLPHRLPRPLPPPPRPLRRPRRRSKRQD